MGYSLRCFYSPDFYMELPADHPYPMDKFRLSKDMLLANGIVRPWRMQSRAARTTSGVMRFRVPSWSSGPHRPQLRTCEEISRKR